MIGHSPTANLILRELCLLVFNSLEIADTIFAVLAVKTGRLDSHDDSLMAVVNTHFRSLNHTGYNHEEILDRIAFH